jgi:hypothetical protein
VHEGICSQTETCISATDKTLGRWSTPDPHCKSYLPAITLMFTVPSGVTESTLWMFTPQKWILHLPKVRRGHNRPFSTIPPWAGKLRQYSVWLWIGWQGLIPYRFLCSQTGCGAYPAFCTLDTGGPFPGDKAWLGHDADHSPSSNAEV